VPANTSTQAFPYPLPSDRPCDYPTTMAALAAALDAKGQNFDVDVARLAKRRSVKVSATDTTISTAGSYIFSFDTVEYNNSTPTDLSVDPARLQLQAGHWMLEAKIIVPTNSAGTNYHAHFSSSPGAMTSGADTSARDYGSSWSPTTITFQDLAFLATGTGKVGLSMVYGGVGSSIPISYVSLAAWWVADA
jgi:hypothetical protein